MPGVATAGGHDALPQAQDLGGQRYEPEALVPKLSVGESSFEEVANDKAEQIDRVECARMVCASCMRLLGGVRPSTRVSKSQAPTASYG
jgi:hypothetical protein